MATDRPSAHPPGVVRWILRGKLLPARTENHAIVPSNTTTVEQTDARVQNEGRRKRQNKRTKKEEKKDLHIPVGTKSPSQCIHRVRPAVGRCLLVQPCELLAKLTREEIPPACCPVRQRDAMACASRRMQGGVEAVSVRVREERKVHFSVTCPAEVNQCASAKCGSNPREAGMEVH